MGGHRDLWRPWGGVFRRVGDHTAPPGRQGGGSSPEALRTLPSSAPCSAADAAVSDAHSEVGLQLDHQVRPLLLSGHHRPPVAKLSPAHTLLCSHPSSSHTLPTPPSQLPGSCCDPTLPLPWDGPCPLADLLVWACSPRSHEDAYISGWPTCPRPPPSPPSKGQGRAGATPQALQVQRALTLQ